MLGTLLSPLLVRGLCFDMSTHVNEFLAAKPGVKVYENYTKISKRWCNNFIQCVFNKQFNIRYSPSLSIIMISGYIIDMKKYRLLF